MGRTLLTWSDRGVRGPRPAHQSARPMSDRGPVMRVVDESEAKYEAAIVLATSEGKGPALELVSDLKTSVDSVEIIVLPLKDPSDYSALFEILQPVLRRFDQDGEVDLLLSAGTPQMQTLWFILVKAGLLRARMLQVIPAAFVPTVHPKAIRVVDLDIEGFPEVRALREEVVRLRAHSKILGRHIIGESEAMHTLAKRLLRVAPSELPVLIQGETGTGKELIARSIHESSLRASGALITENCGALTESVLSSELFGHEKGAFTGAVHRKRGLFELAHGGTLFLDEVGELSPRVQVNLLRVLQDGTLRRLGSETSIRVDVRIVAATHRDLLAMVREGSFREDLYYRLQGATLTVPPLRDRKDDIQTLVTHFLSELGSSLRVTRDCWPILQGYAWPGNVRELRAEVHRWHVFCDQWVRPEELDPKFASPVPLHKIESELVASSRSLSDAVALAERECIAVALSEARNNLSRAARLLEVDRNTLKRKIRKHGIRHQSLPTGRPADDW